MNFEDIEGNQIYGASKVPVIPMASAVAVEVLPAPCNQLQGFKVPGGGTKSLFMKCHAIVILPAERGASCWKTSGDMSVHSELVFTPSMHSYVYIPMSFGPQPGQLSTVSAYTDFPVAKYSICIH